MAGPATTDIGLLLAREPRGESHQSLGVLARDHGYLTLMRRLPSRRGKLSTNDAADLFDTAELAWAPRTQFVESYRVLNRRVGLASSYRHLEAACTLARWLAGNLPHMAADPARLALAETAFNALTAHHDPPACLFKTLYVLLRDEGYAVREDWLRQLPRDSRVAVRTLLETPLATHDPAAVDGVSLLENLRRWAVATTDLLLPV